MKDRVSLRTSTQWCRRLVVSDRRMFLSLDWLFREMSGVDTVYSVQEEFSALYKRVTAACARGEEVEDDLFYREQQKAKREEIRVSRYRFDEDFP